MAHIVQLATQIMASKAVVFVGLKIPMNILMVIRFMVHTYQNLRIHHFLDCPAHCLTCDSGSVCTSCEANYGIVGTSGVCVSCPTGTYLTGQSCVGISRDYILSLLT